MTREEGQQLLDDYVKARLKANFAISTTTDSAKLEAAFSTVADIGDKLLNILTNDEGVNRVP